MAKLDKFIEMMVQRQAERAVIIGDKPFQIFINGKKTEGSPLPAEQLREALKEITPAHLLSQVSDGGSFHFRYDSSSGPCEIGAETLFDTIQVTLSPSKAESLPTPAESTSLEIAQHSPVAIANSNTAADNSQSQPQQIFCQQCGVANDSTASFCAGCGKALGVAATPGQGEPKLLDGIQSKEVADQVKQASKNALSAFAIFAVNPTGGLAAAYESLDKKRALEVGLVFAVVFEICVALGVPRILSYVPFIGPIMAQNIGLFKLLILGAIPIVSIIGASAAARAMFRGSGTIEGDVFIAGASLLPTGFFIFLAGFLGVANAEIILALSAFALCYTILIMHTGCTRISKIPEGASALAVPIMLMVSGWLTKVIISAG